MCMSVSLKKETAIFHPKSRFLKRETVIFHPKSWLFTKIVDLGAGVEPRGDLSIWMANVEIVVVPKCIIHCKNNTFGSN